MTDRSLYTDDARGTYISRMESAFASLALPGVNRGALISMASYIFRNGGVKWAMDPSFTDAAEVPGVRERAAELLRDFDLIVITHGHRDHFERETVEALRDMDIPWLLPDFLKEDALRYGLPERRLLTARAGEVIRFRGMEFLPFPGKHFRPVTHDGLPELGFRVTAQDGTVLLFPCDVRDYTPDDSGLSPCDYLFGHVWLSDDNRDPEVCRRCAAAQARYRLNFRPGKLILAHLYDWDRKDSRMWRREHAVMVRDAVLSLRPGLPVEIPYAGEPLPLC